MEPGGKLKTRKTTKRIKKIRDLHLEKKLERNWPIRGKVVFYKHSFSKCGKFTSKKGQPCFKCAFEDDSGQIEAIAIGRGLDETFHKHFKKGKIIKIDWATLKKCHKDFRYISNHPYYISLDSTIEWEYARTPPTRKNTKSQQGSRKSPRGKKIDTSDERMVSLQQVFPDLSRDLIHPEWKFFFRYLFDDADKYIHEAELNNQGNVREQIHTILKDWVEREKGNATPQRLVTALQNNDRMDIIEKYFPSYSKTGMKEVKTEVNCGMTEVKTE